MRRVILLSLFTVLAFSLVNACSADQKSSDPKARLMLTIREAQIDTHIILEIPFSNSSETYFLVVPFALDTKTTSFPFNCLSPLEVLQDRYSFFTIVAPPNSTQIEILAVARKLLTAEGEWLKLSISFTYLNAPEPLRDILSDPRTIMSFETVEVIFDPSVNLDQIMESPPASNATGNIRIYNASLIEELGRGTLSIQYSAAGSFWYVEMFSSAIVGIAAAFALTKVNIPKQKRRYWLLIPVFFTFLWAGYATMMLILKGVTWDLLSKYYPAVMEVCASMGLWFRRIFGKQAAEEISDSNEDLIEQEIARAEQLPNARNRNNAVEDADNTLE